MNRRGFFSSILHGVPLLVGGAAVAQQVTGRAQPTAPGTPEYDRELMNQRFRELESGVAIARADRERPEWPPSITEATAYVANEALSLMRTTRFVAVPGFDGYGGDYPSLGTVMNTEWDGPIVLNRQFNRGVTPENIWRNGIRDQDLCWRVFFRPAAVDLAREIGDVTANPISALWRRREVITAVLQLPIGVAGAHVVVTRGMALRGVQVYDFERDLVRYRFDVLYGFPGDGGERSSTGCQLLMVTPNWSEVERVQTPARFYGHGTEVRA